MKEILFCIYLTLNIVMSSQGTVNGANLKVMIAEQLRNISSKNRANSVNNEIISISECSKLVIKILSTSNT